LRFWRPRSIQLWACTHGAAGVEVTVGVTGFVARCGASLLIELNELGDRGALITPHLASAMEETAAAPCDRH
jgi:hypothetical protein